MLLIYINMQNSHAFPHVQKKKLNRFLSEGEDIQCLTHRAKHSQASPSKMLYSVRRLRNFAKSQFKYRHKKETDQF